MNTYTFDELSTGMKCSFKVSVTQDMMEKFMDITGDKNPMHTDREFAIKKGYEREIVYGMLTASFMSTVAGMYLPGERSLIHQVESKFLKPVYVGDRLQVNGEIKEKNELFNLIEISVSIYNERQEKVFKGKMKVGVTGDGS